MNHIRPLTAPAVLAFEKKTLSMKQNVVVAMLKKSIVFSQYLKVHGLLANMILIPVCEKEHP